MRFAPTVLVSLTLTALWTPWTCARATSQLEAEAWFGTSAEESLELCSARFSAEHRRQCLEALIDYWGAEPEAVRTVAEARRLLARHTRRGPAFAIWSQTNLSPPGYDGSGMMAEVVFGLGLPLRKPGRTRDSSILVYWGIGAGGKGNGDYGSVIDIPVGVAEFVAWDDGRGNRVGVWFAQGVMVNIPNYLFGWMHDDPLNVWIEYDVQFSFAAHDRRDFLFSAGFRLAAGPGLGSLLPGIVIRVGGMEFLP